MPGIHTSEEGRAELTISGLAPDAVCWVTRGGPTSPDCGVSAPRQSPALPVPAAWARHKFAVAWMPRHGTDSASRPGTNPEKSAHHDNGSRSGPRCVDRPCPSPATVFAPLVGPRGGRL